LQHRNLAPFQLRIDRAELRQGRHLVQMLRNPGRRANGDLWRKAQPHWNAKLSLRLVGRARGLLGLLLIELVLAAARHQVTQRAKVQAARLQAASRSLPGHDIADAVGAGADETGLSAGLEGLHVRAQAEARTQTGAARSAPRRIGISVGRSLARCHSRTVARRAGAAGAADLRVAEHAAGRGAPRLGERQAWGGNEQAQGGAGAQNHAAPRPNFGRHHQ
jgi:hypothetical protein